MPQPALSPAEEEAFRQELGRRIRLWRDGHGLTRIDLVMRAPFSERTISRWEAGMAPGPRVVDIYALERIQPGLVASVFPQNGDILGRATS